MENSQRLPSQLDLFFYTGNDRWVEDLTRYKRYGLHPIILGDILPKPCTCVSDLAKKQRYRIVQKLGFGAFATVWLARDLIEKRYVAVKVCLGSDMPDLNRETEILSQLRETGRGKPGYQRVIQLFDVFVIEGPNGFHECLVTEVISPLSDIDVMEQCSSEAIRQIVEGFAFLHEQGIAHGDPHVGNLGIALPQLERFDEDDIVEYFSNPEMIPVIPRDPSMIPLHSVPPYLAQTVSIAEFLESKKSFPASSEMSIRILDFGRSYRTSEKVPLLPGAAPEAIRPPEVVVHELYKGKVGSIWSKAADIWAVGCTLYHIRSGGDLFYMWGSLDDHLIRTVELGGPPPKAWLELWNTCDRHRENSSRSFNAVEAWQVHEARRIPSRCRHDEEREVFLDLIKKMIVTKPDERGLMAELLTHPFIRKRTEGVSS
ncbi:kinase-like domain-containing protein [Diplogelasinospora grovesii]|uniref:Kinase-like domain-containing protein n=1 Tax=Diplogelasinospora grovesii TaxID=303347 RepID=A0AAN6NJ11_9PEZI|nr:kinase-like domain-containing protein [Diplogelasinospora grovesii]